MAGEIKVWISGVSMTPFSKASQDTFAALGQKAVLGALDDADLSVDEVEEFYCGTGYGGPLAGQRVGGPVGLSGMPIVNVENACSSGMAALAFGMESIMGGRARKVLVLGIDKLSRLGRGTLPLESTDVEVQQGATMPAIYAMRARRYLYETDATVEDLAAIAVKARKGGSANPYAQMRKLVSEEEVLESRLVADPLTLFMCCPGGDGAAAVVLSADPPGDARPGVGFRSLSLLSGRYTDGFRNMTRSDLSERTIDRAYRSARVTPADLQVAETHDAFAIAEIMYYEALGFAPYGQGWKLARQGRTAHDGSIAVNPSGGLLARGHPVGATGVAQVCEAYWQLCGQAGANQVDSVRNVVTHCTGGGIAGFDHGACGVAIVGRA